MKKRAILHEVDALANGIYVDEDGLAAKVKSLEGKLADLTDMASKVAWLEARVDLLATRLENMRGNVTLDAAAAQRLTFAVGQFSARLDRLEAPRPRGRPRKPKPEPPNGASEETEDPQQESQSHDPAV